MNLSSHDSSETSVGSGNHANTNTTADTAHAMIRTRTVVRAPCEMLSGVTVPQDCCLRLERIYPIKKSNTLIHNPTDTKVMFSGAIVQAALNLGSLLT